MSNTETTETDGGVGGSANGSGGEDDIFNPTLRAVEELYDTRDNYFPLNPLDKISRTQGLITCALQLLDSIPVEKRNSPMQRATYEYLRGKILDSLPNYKKEAEEHLSKAVKLNPSLGDAWLSLGNCIWKKGDTTAAKNCMMLALNKGPNKRILCQLSMLERKMAQDSMTSEELVEESIKHAREAVAMDVMDGYTWYNLGNAFLYSFFVNGAWDLSELRQSLKAYQNAERDSKMKDNPDLSFNSATVNKYLENYERALSGFEAAALKDPGLKADQEIRKMVELFDIIRHFLNAHTEAKEIAALDAIKYTIPRELNAVELNPPYRRATLDILQEGVNKTFAIVGKVVFSFNNENHTPVYYSLYDSNYQCYILSVYGSQPDAIKVGDQVTILDPCYHHQDFTWKEKRYVFESLRVDFLEQVRVYGKALSPLQTAPSSIFAQHKPL